MCCRYLRNITIPAAFITKSDGDALKTLLKVDSSGSSKEVVVVMDWKDALPAADKVTWEFWSNSNDMCGPVCDVQKEFIKVRFSATGMQSLGAEIYRFKRVSMWKHRTHRTASWGLSVDSKTWFC